MPQGLCFKSAFGPAFGRANVSALWGQKGHFQPCMKGHKKTKSTKTTLQSARDESVTELSTYGGKGIKRIALLAPQTATYSISIYVKPRSSKQT